MRLITFKPKRGGVARTGVLLDAERALDIGDVAKRARKRLPFDPADMVSLIESGKAGLAAVSALVKSYRGKGVKLQTYREGGLRDALVFDETAGMSTVDASGRTRLWQRPLPLMG